MPRREPRVRLGASLEKLESLFTGRRGRVLLLAALAVTAALVVAAFYVRAEPWFNAWKVVTGDPRFAHLETRWFGFLHGNDPWIEYWMTYKLWRRGLGYWWCLNPHCDPDTKLFWWPWGRDFTHTAYPLPPMLAAATYHGGMPLQAWAAIWPAIMGALLTAVMFVAVWRLTGSLAAGVIAALLAAGLPANISRTMAGFIEKEGYAMPLLIASLWLLGEALRFANRGEKAKALIAAAIGGVVAGLIAWTWGGYRFPIIFAAAVGLLLPLALRGEEGKLLLAEAAVVTFIALNVASAATSPQFGKGSSLLAVAAAAATLVSLGVWLALRRVVRREERVAVAYLAYLVVVFAAAVGVALSGVIPGLAPTNRAVIAFLWPWRAELTRNVPPLVRSVAEFSKTTPAMAWQSMGIVYAAAPFAILVLAYYTLYRRRRPELLPALVAGSIGWWLALGMAYFLQLGGTLGTLLTACILAPLGDYLRRSVSAPRKSARRAAEEETRHLALVGYTIIAVILVIAGLVTLARAAHLYSVVVPSALTGGVGSSFAFTNPTWLVALQEIKHGTPEGSVVVTWWDYGYWVTVGAHRATLADGATINGTQIHLLARMLVSDENTSTKLMRSFGLKPGTTYVLVNDVVAYNPSTGDAIYLDLVDVPKSYWMVNIGGFNPSEYFRVVRVGNAAVMVPNTASPAVRHALIYDILVDAAYHLSDANVTVTDGKFPVVRRVFLSLVDAQLGLAFPKPRLHHFKPWRIFAYRIPGLTLATATGGSVPAYLVVAVYKWVG